MPYDFTKSISSSRTEFNGENIYAEFDYFFKKYLLDETLDPAIRKELKERNDVFIDSNFKQWLEALIADPNNPERIDLNNPQHFILLAKRYIDLIKKGDLNPSQFDLEHEQTLWKIERITAPDPNNAYKTALLGTGASIAYYIHSNRGLLKPWQTVVIGKMQPWDMSAENKESRGINFINHPMHMISPLRNEASDPVERFEGNQSILTAEINQILAPYGDRTYNTTIYRISRTTSKWYKIETGAPFRPFYALNVVAGLGIGPHKMDDNPLKSQIIGPQKEIEKMLVLDLDNFQRQLKDDNSYLRTIVTKKGGFDKVVIGLSGPNAGVDAAYTATKSGMEVKWIVSSGPAIGSGTGNIISEDQQKLIELYFRRLEGWTIDNKSEFNKVALTLTKPAEGYESKEKPFKDKGFKVWKESLDNPKQKIEVDFLVIAQGPDISKVWNLFDTKSITNKLTLSYDQNHRFSALKETDVIGAENIKVSIKVHVDKILKGRDEAFFVPTYISLYQKSKTILDIDEFSDLIPPIKVAIGLGVSDETLKIIGASAGRMLIFIDGVIKMREAELKKLMDELSKSGASEIKKSYEIWAKLTNLSKTTKLPFALQYGSGLDDMRKVISTLPASSILGNEQLTPIRSQIEVMGNYMPGYIGKDKSNFVTDDQTMIAAQIAGNYYNIPPVMADWITQKIIKERNPKTTGVIPGSPDWGSNKFNERWYNRLGDLNKLFSEQLIIEHYDEAILKAQK